MDFHGFPHRHGHQVDLPAGAMALVPSSIEQVVAGFGKILAAWKALPQVAKVVEVMAAMAMPWPLLSLMLKIVVNGD